MDPISIISLAGATTKAAYTVSTQLYLFVNAVKNVDESVKNLTSELSGLRRSLDATSVALQNPLVKSETAAAPENVPIWAAVAGALDDCRVTLETFERQVSPHQREQSRRGIFRRAATTWKLDLTKVEINRVRDQVHTHTGSLQIALQTLNILISGLAPATAAKDIGKSIATLTESLRLTSLDERQYQSDHYDEVQRVARAVLSDAPDFVSTGLLSSNTTESQSAACASLRAVVKRFDASIYARSSAHDAVETVSQGSATQYDGGGGFDSGSGLSDSENELELSLAEELVIRGRLSVRAGKYKEAEAFLRDAFGHITDSTTATFEFDLDEVKYELALCCLYQSKVEEAELILLLLVRDQVRQDDKSLRASHALAMVYLLLFDFSSALEYCTIALRGRKRLFGKHDGRGQSSSQLLALLYHANGDFVSSKAHSGKLPSDRQNSSENTHVNNVFGGYLPLEHLRMSLQEKQEALNELAAADMIPSQRNIDANSTNGLTALTRVVHHPDLSSLNLKMIIMWAVQNNKPIVVKFVLSRGAHPDGGLDTSPLLTAADRGFTEVVRTLLEAGSNVSIGDREERSPLYWAALWGYLEVVRLLLKHGADVNFADKDGETPLVAAACKGHTLVVETLLSHGAAIQTRTGVGRTALVHAIRNCHPDTAKAIIDGGADVNLAGDDRETPLHLAISLGNEPLVKLLLRKGANVDARDGSGATPLLCVPSNSRPSITRTLLRHGADINATDNKGQTALVRACDWDSVALLRTLLDCGADTTAGNQEVSLASFAKQRGSSKCLAILRKLPDSPSKSMR